MVHGVLNCDSDPHSHDDWEGIRSKIPPDLMAQITEKFGNPKWSDCRGSVLIVDSLEGYAEPGSNRLLYFHEFISGVGGVDDLLVGVNFVEFSLDGQKFVVEGKREQRFVDDFLEKDGYFAGGLEALNGYLPSDARVLYLGSGGEMSVKREFGDRCVNLDLSGNYLEAGDIRADGRNMPFKDETFDMVVLRGMAHVIEDPDLIVEISRVLKNGGLVFYPQITRIGERDILNDPHSSDDPSEPIDVYKERAASEILGYRDRINSVFLEHSPFEFEPVEVPGMERREYMSVLRVKK